MAVVAHLPEKRFCDVITEDHFEKRQKLEHTTELQQRSYCPICNIMTYHTISDCPDRATAMGRWCRLCGSPCKQNEEGEHGRNIVVMMKRCSYCLTPGDHWAEDCPVARSDDEKQANYPVGLVEADF